MQLQPVVLAVFFAILCAGYWHLDSDDEPTLRQVASESGPVPTFTPEVGASGVSQPRPVPVKSFPEGGAIPASDDLTKRIATWVQELQKGDTDQVLQAHHELGACWKQTFRESALMEVMRTEASDRRLVAELREYVLRNRAMCAQVPMHVVYSHTDSLERVLRDGGRLDARVVHALFVAGPKGNPMPEDFMEPSVAAWSARMVDLFEEASAANDFKSTVTLAEILSAGVMAPENKRRSIELLELARSLAEGDEEKMRAYGEVKTRLRGE
jgi:hypothetical protein